METLTVRIESLEDVASNIGAALKDRRGETHAVLSFLSYEDMHRILSPKRLDIIRAMTGQGPLSFREVARRTARDYKGVHTDLSALVNAGIVDRAANGVEFPYEKIHVEFDISTQAA